MRRTNIIPDLSFLPVVCLSRVALPFHAFMLTPIACRGSQTTQQHIQNMLAYIQIQKELRKVPRVEG